MRVPLRVLARAPRRRRAPRRDARRAARPPVPAVRAAVVQHPQARGRGNGSGDGSAVGSAQLAGAAFFQETARSITACATGSAWRSGSRRSRRCPGRSETKRLHTWLFVVLGAAVLLKIYEFRVLDWVGRLAGRRADRLSGVRAARRARSRSRCSRASASRSCWTRDLRLRRFLILLGGASLLLLIVIRTHGDRWSVITSATRNPRSPRGGAAVCLFAALAIAAVVLGASSRSEVARAPPRSGDRRRAPRARPVLDLREASRSVTSLPAGCHMSGRRSGPERHSRVFGLDGKLYPNTAGALGLQDIRALDALYVERYLRYVRTFIAPTRLRSVHGHRAPGRVPGQPDVRRALGTRRSSRSTTLADVPGSGCSAATATRVSTRTRTAFPGLGRTRRSRRRRRGRRVSRISSRERIAKEGAFVVDGFDPRRAGGGGEPREGSGRDAGRTQGLASDMRAGAA